MTERPSPPVTSARFLARLFLWTLGSDLLSRAAVLLTMLVAIRSLAPDEFGQYATLAAISLLAASIWDTGVSNLLTRELAAGHLTTHDAIRQAYALRVRTLVLWVVVLICGVAIIDRDRDIPALVVALFIIGSFISGISLIPLALLRARLYFRAAGVAAACGRWTMALLSVTTIYAFREIDPFILLAVSSVVGEIIILILASLSTTRVEVADKHGISTTLTIKSSAPFAMNSVLTTAYNRFDLVILTALTSQQQLGLYAPASRIQDALYVIPSSISMVAFPVISRMWNHGRGILQAQHLITRFVIFGTVGMIAIAVPIFIFTPQMISIAFGSEYSGSATAIRVIVWSLPLAAIGGPLLAGLAGSGRAADTTKAYALAFVTAITMHLALDWWWGATGGAVASLSRDGANVLAAVFFARRAGLLGHRIGVAPTSDGTVVTEVAR